MIGRPAVEAKRESGHLMARSISSIEAPPLKTCPAGERQQEMGAKTIIRTVRATDLPEASRPPRSATTGTGAQARRYRRTEADARDRDGGREAAPDGRTSERGSGPTPP